jgi:hypothetical protein
VAVAKQTTMNDTIRFVFVGVNIATNVPFIGSLAYLDTTADAATFDFIFNCDVWNTTNYNIHTIDEFLYDTNDANNNHLDFFVVVVE